LFSLILGTLFVIYRKDSFKKTIIFLAIGFILLGYVNQGNKFSPLYFNLLLFFIPFLTTLKLRLDRRKFKNILLTILLGSAFLIGVINLSMKEYSITQGSENASEFVLYRILGLQGHVWWGTDYLENNLNEIDKKNNLINEFDVISLSNDGLYTSGLNSLMLFISPQIGAAYIENGVSFTMGFPAILIYTLNTFELCITLILMGMFLGLFVRTLHYYISRNKFFPMILLGYVYIYGIMQFFTMGRTYALFNERIYFTLVLFFCYYIFYVFSRKGQSHIINLK